MNHSTRISLLHILACTSTELRHVFDVTSVSFTNDSISVHWEWGRLALQTAVVRIGVAIPAVSYNASGPQITRRPVSGGKLLLFSCPCFLNKYRITGGYKMN